MNTRMRFLLAVLVVVTATLAFQRSGLDFPSARGAESATAGELQTASRPHGKTLAAFRSEAELKAFLKKASIRFPRAVHSDLGALPMLAMAAPAEAPHAQPEGITNTQHAGVDEGGIVKMHGEHLVVLRRGRLFTVDISKGQLTPISMIDAFGPEMSADGAWYDEMLVSDNKVVVIGYSYQRVGTEISLFNIDAAGRLTYRSTYHLRSNDYYSTRNYASRLVGSKLILYSPLAMPTVERGRVEGMPGMRKWSNTIASSIRAAGFIDTASATSIYRVPTSTPGSLALHTLTTCDLSAPELQCKASAVLGNFSEVFYVSPTAVYVWTSGSLFRMPLDGGAPQAARVTGMPVDQFSFDEAGDGYLNVVTRAGSRGNWMGNAELADGELALLHLPLSSFGDGTPEPSTLDYRRLPSPEPGSFQNRFVHGKLLYGSSGEALFVVDPASGYTSVASLPHGVERIEVMGDDAVVVGARGNNLHFTGVRLAGRPSSIQHYVLSGAGQSESRSHGFFYRATAKGAGLLGLPVQTVKDLEDGEVRDDAASIVFLKNADDRFEPLGNLVSASRSVVDDACQASCVDWYGNARPIFVGGRVLALMGYEIVEGNVQGNAIRETQRTSFAPRARLARAE